LVGEHCEGDGASGEGLNVCLGMLLLCRGTERGAVPAVPPAGHRCGDAQRDERGAAADCFNVVAVMIGSLQYQRRTIESASLRAFLDGIRVI